MFHISVSLWHPPLLWRFPRKFCRYSERFYLIIIQAPRDPADSKHVNDFYSDSPSHLIMMSISKKSAIPREDLQRFPQLNPKKIYRNPKRNYWRNPRIIGDMPQVSSWRISDGIPGGILKKIKKNRKGIWRWTSLGLKLSIIKLIKIIIISKGIPQEILKGSWK